VSRRRLLIAAMLVTGMAVGCAVALLSRGAPATARATPFVSIGVARAVQRLPIAPAGPVVIAARAADPGGAKAWAVRRVTARQGKTTFPCSQLGRLDGTRFGWISANRPFRLARLDQLDVPTMCGERFSRGMPQLSLVTLTTDGTTGLPRPERTVVWGVLPPGVTSARLDDGTRLAPGPGAARVVLAVLPSRPLGEPRLTGTLTTTRATTRRFAYPDPARILDDELAHRRTSDRPTARPKGGTPIRSRVVIAARVPDPAGGAAWGITTAPSTTGATCFSSPAHLVGTRPALVDPRLSTASPHPFAALSCSDRRAPDAARPLRMDVLLTSIPEQDPSGSLQLRRLDTRTVLYGRATAAVRTVTITTSRDIRTLVPDRRTHVVLAVYDGDFPGERLKFTATLRDGRRVTLLQSSGA